MSHPYGGEYHEDKQMKGENMLKHTPNPWIIKNSSIVGGPYGQPICELEEWPNGADASLIASAPELLEACKSALIAIDQVQYMQVYERILSAIAKAEGRA